MCGYYTRNECGKSNPHKLEPISNPEQILAFLESAKSFHGVKPLRRIVDYVLPYSRSIKETQLALQLCLPNHLHGFALPKPQLNYRIDIPFAERAMLGADSYTVDFCWPKYRLAMEYDSEAFHGESNRKADAKRRNGLRYLGYLVIESNASDLRTTFDASRLAERLAALMKLKAKPRQFDVTAEKIKTHGQIMGLSTFP